MTVSPNPAGVPGAELARVRARWADELPAHLARAMDAYRAVAMQDAPTDSKAFAAHQAACKQALAHIEGLIKLSRWADDETAPIDDAEDVDGLIDRAEAALRGFAEEAGA